MLGDLEPRPARYTVAQVDLDAEDLTGDLLQASACSGLADAFSGDLYATTLAGSILQHPRREWVRVEDLLELLASVPALEHSQAEAEPPSEGATLLQSRQ